MLHLPIAPGIFAKGRASNRTETGVTSLPKTEQDRNSKRISEELKSQKRNLVNLLLLGAGGAGKTTFLRQMEIIHGAGFTDPSVAATYTEIIFLNIIQCIKNLTIHMEKLGLSYADSLNEIYSQQVGRQVYSDIVSIGQDGSPRLSAEYAQIARSLWVDEGVAKCFRRRAEFRSDWVHDNLPYFMDAFDRIVAPGYIPEQQDILNMRTKTLGCSYKEFELQSSTFRLTDVGGQRSARGIWRDLLHECSAVIFLASLSDYDQTLEENKVVENCFIESVGLFKEIVRIIPRSFILFMNKEDLLREKAAVSPMQNFIPEYDPNFDYVNNKRSSAAPVEPAENVKYFIKLKLVEQWPGSNENVGLNASGGNDNFNPRASGGSRRRTSRRGAPRQRGRRDDDDEEEVVPCLYPHFMCANDTSIVRRVFEDVKHVILQTAVDAVAMV